MNKKRIIISFCLVLIVFAQAFTACSKNEDEPTTNDETESQSKMEVTAPEGLEFVTDENGEKVTTIKVDENGNEQIYNVYVPAGQNKPNEEKPSEQKEPPTYTGQPSDPQTSTSAINEIIEAFNKNRFHIVSIIDGKEETDLMVYDDNVRIDMQFDEENRLSLGVIGGNFYMINPKLKTYTSLSKTMLKMYNFDLDELNIVGEFKDKFVKVFQTSGEPQISAVSLDGKALTSYTYKNSEGNSVSFYLDGNTPVKIESYKPDGSIDFNMAISSFRSNIKPEDVNVLSVYTKKDIFRFIADMA